LPFPVVAFLQNPTMQNPFIEPGEYYVAGNEGWNPFGPRFPGDTGSVDTRSFGQNPQQEEFHLFVQCASQSHKRLWHGKNARDGRLYVVSYSFCCCLCLWLLSCYTKYLKGAKLEYSKHFFLRTNIT
jgi:hypothetical protein